MNKKNRNQMIGLLLLAGALAMQKSHAQSTDTWVGGTATAGLYDFNTTVNWTYSSGSGPVVTGDSLMFAGTGSTTPTNNEVGFVFDAITFNSGAQAYTIVGNSFTLGTTTPSTAITVNSANAQIIKTPIVLAAAAQTISLPSGNLTLSGAISGTGGGITLSGPGTLTLTNAAADTYTGPTVVNGGTLDLGFPNAGNSGIYLSSGLTINSGGTVGSSDNALAGSTSTLGALPITINAGGTLTGISSADAGAGGSSHIRGVLTLDGGTLANAGTGAEPAYGSWDLDDGVVVNGGTTASTISALDVIPDQGGGTYFNVANGGTVGGIDLNVTGTLINGSTTHDTGILKTNTGTMALWGTNTYAGATIIAGGTLELSGAGELGSGTYAGAIAISNNATFIYNSSQPQTLSGVISGSGSLTYSGAGPLTLSGVSSYNGAISISSGTLTIGGAGVLGAGNYAGNISDGGNLIYNSSASQTWSGGISGSGTLTLSGSGTLTFPASGGAANVPVQITPGTGNTSTLGISSTGSSSQWTCSSLTFNSGGLGTALQFTFTGTPSTTTAPLNVTGNLTFNVTPTIFLATSIASGSYPLLVVGGTAPVAVPTLNQRGFTGAASLAWGGSGFSANTLVLTVSGSFSPVIDPLNWAASSSGTWDINDSGNAVWKDSSATSQTTFYQQINGATGDSVLFGDKYGSANNTVTLNTTVTPAKVVATNFSNNYIITGTGTIAGSGGLTKFGAAGLTISTTNTFTGGVVDNGGTLALDFTASGAPMTNIINPANALTLGGATLNVNGNSGTANSQTFNGLTLSSGANVINVVNNGTAPTLNLGALSYAGNAMLEFSTNGASTITTTTAGGGPLGLMWTDYATFGLVDWASTDTTAGGVGTSPYTIKGLSTVTGGYTTTMGGTGQGINLDLQASYTAGGNVGATTIRFNTPSATSVNVNGKWVVCNAVLVTTNMGANNCSIGNGNWFAVYNTAAATEWVVQNNTAAYFTIGSLINDKGGAGALTYVQTGPGTVVMPGTSTVSGAAGNSANNYTGASYLIGGSTVVKVDADLGAPATAAAVYLNGGTIVGNATFALDNGGGANPRPITLGNDGGGLAAAAGTTLTVDGQIGSAAGTGPLVIGIPASSANGNVAGLLPGSGAGTANATPVYGTGTVILNYPNGANGNFFYGGVNILGGATLNINSQYALGGANYGGMTFNNGTLQYNATLATGAAGSALDISGAPVAFAGNATIDVNGHTIAYANAIGNGGGGFLTVTNSGTAGAGALLLNGGSSHTAGTLVASGAVLGGTGTIGGNVIWAGGSYAALTQGSPLTVSGSVSLTNPTVQVIASGLTTGTYTLMTATGGITAGSTVNPVPAGSGFLANGYGGTVSISGSSVILTVVQLGVADTWTDGSADQNWSELGNWSGGSFVPHNPGDAATFGTGGVGSPVNLNQNETVGSLAFDNAGSYTITGGNTLTLDNKGNGIAISVTAGTANAVNTAITLNGNVTATVNSGDSLAFGGAIANETSPETMTLTGGGTAVLSAANSYGPAASGTVGTTLGSVTLQVGNNNALGAGDVNVTANSTLQAGTSGLNLANNLAVAASHTVTVGGNNLTLSGVISGNGTLAASTGNVLLGGANNTYAGGTVLNGGSLGISSEGAAPGTPGGLGIVPTSVTPNNISFNGGDLLAAATLTLQTNRGLAIGSNVFANTNTTTALIDAAAGQSFTIAGVIASAGNTGANNLTVNSEAGSTGTVILGGINTFNGTNIISAGEEQLANALALQNSTLFYNHQGGVLDFGPLTAATLNGLLGAQNLTLVNDSSAALALTLGNNNQGPLLYTGVLGDGGSGASLTINGTGSQQIGAGGSGGATYTGSTTLNKGSLILGGNTSLSGALTMSGINGPCNLTLQDSAVFAVTGAIDMASAGGSAYPGVCTLTLQGNAAMTASAFNFGLGNSRMPSCVLTLAGNASLNLSGGLELEDSEGSTPENNVVNLNGGTLATTGFTLTDGAVGVHQATLNFNGGVLEANASDPSGSTFLPAFAALTVNVLSNGVVINPNGFNITLSPVLSGTGGLTNLGTTGALNLSAANTYAGATFITNGATLNVINTTGSATGTNTVTVGTGGTLQGTGTIAGNVIWQPGALAAFSAGYTPSPLTVGVVTLNNNEVTVNVPGNTPLTIGSYKLMYYTNSGSTGVFNATPNITGAGVNGNASIITANGLVTLSVTPNVIADVWDVDADGNWTDASKWSSNPTVPGNPGDEATLGVGTALRTVTLNANESLGYLNLTNANSFVIAGGNTLTLDNSGNGAYVTVSGGGANQIQTAVALNDSATVTLNNGSTLTVSGVVANSPGASQPETLTVNGAGTLILTNNNSYGPASGQTGTTLNGATLQVGKNNSLGAGDVNVAVNSTLQAGAAGLVLTNNLDVASGATVTLNDNGSVFTLGGAINGSGAVTKVGAGTLNLTNNNNFSGALVVSNGAVVLSSANSGGSGSVTNNAILQLANASAVSGELTLDSGSTLQLRADTSATFSPAGLLPQNASDTLTFDVGPATAGVTGNTLTLNGTLGFGNSSDQAITVTGNSTYTLALGAITLTAYTAGGAGNHTPYLALNLNTLPGGSDVSIASVTAGAWGNDVNMKGGGNVTVTGNLGNISNGALDLFVNDGTTATLQGASVKSNGGDAFRYEVEHGTLVLDNSGALINDTTAGGGLNTSYFILGAATNVFYGTGIAPAAGVLVTNNNSYNAAVYLGDANNPSGGLTVAATITNYVSDGDAGFTNSGTFTLGGQNTSGVNTYANPIILGWTANKGKSVTLVAATGGEVDFTGGILANGTDTTAGITVGNATFNGLVKLGATNTYAGPTVITNGTLALANMNGYDAYIGNSTGIAINSGATLDVTGQGSGTLPLGTGTVAQTLSGSGTLNGSLVIGSLGTVAPGTTAATGQLTVNTSATLGGTTLIKLNNAGSPTSDELISPAISAGGTLTVTNIGPALMAGNTFHLFNSAVSGFTAVNLPATANGYNYTWNNQLAANGTIVVQAVMLAVNTNAATANFKGVNTGTSLQFTWAPDHKGWQLYTNSVGLSASGSWFPVTGSSSVTNETIAINPARPNVFFQLRYP